MIDAEENSSFGEIHQQGDQIAASSQQLVMLPLAQVVNTDVSLGPAGHLAGEFRTHEEVRQVAEFLRAFYRVVVGKGEQIHSAPAQLRIQLSGIAVTFSAEIFDKGSGTGSGKV